MLLYAQPHITTLKGLKSAFRANRPFTDCEGKQVIPKSIPEGTEVCIKTRRRTKIDTLMRRSPAVCTNQQRIIRFVMTDAPFQT